MSFEEDPEVAADRALRQRIEWERGRSRGSEPPTWQPPPTVTSWPCRGCKAPVEITAEVVEQMAVFNRQLERNGEPPLDTSKIAICQSCRDKRWAMLAQRNRDRTEKLAAAIRELRGGATLPQPPGPAPSRAREVELMRDIIALGHPDPDGLSKVISEARNAGGRGRNKGAL